MISRFDLATFHLKTCQIQVSSYQTLQVRVLNSSSSVKAALDFLSLSMIVYGLYEALRIIEILGDPCVGSVIDDRAGGLN